MLKQVRRLGYRLRNDGRPTFLGFTQRCRCKSEWKRELGFGRMTLSMCLKMGMSDVPINICPPPPKKEWGIQVPREALAQKCPSYM